MGILMIFNDIFYVQEKAAYIAGRDDGVVTAGGQVESRMIYVFDATTLHLIQATNSLKNGHYLITGLDENKQYLIMCRDYKKEYEPVCFDYVTPATDLTIAEQQELWESWQTT